MRVNRSKFVGLLALVTAVGMLGVNGYYWWLSNSRQTDSLNRSTAYRSTPQQDESVSGPAWNESESSDSPSPYRDFDREPKVNTPSRQFFPNYREGIEIAQADGLDAAPAEKAPSGSVPPPLLLPDSPTPLADPPVSDWLKELVKQEFPEANPEERRIWSQELRGLAPEMAREILRMRKSVTDDPAIPHVVTRPNSVDELPPAFHSPSDEKLVPPPTEIPGMQDPTVAAHLRDSISALKTARNVALNNLVNVQTPGFKRMRVILAERPYELDQPEEPEDGQSAPRVAVGRGVAIGCTLLDLTQGDLLETNQQFDLAIQGQGFFRVRVGKEIQYTRLGMCSLNEKGEICIINGGKPCPLEPSIVVPEQSDRLQIASDGTVNRFEAGRDTPRQLGQISLVRFINPSRLRPLGNQFYSATKASGPPNVGTADADGVGSLLQGFLESSNALRNEELEQVQQLQTQLRTLDQLANSRPVEFSPGPVARGSKGKAKRTSAEAIPVPPPALKSFLEIKDQSRSLIDEYLQSQRVQSIRRTLGLK